MNAATTQHAAGPDTDRRARRQIAGWLFFMCALVAIMVLVGGATRLTDSGLSIVEWRPVTGAIPPLSEAAWEAELAKYRTIPEYQLVNKGMSVDAFKAIYWWEWGHRFLGRLIGVAFFIPFVYFVATGKARGALALKLGALFVLGGFQGALGWWMVSSGLADRVDVSQYRLAAHLGLAILLFGAMAWLALDLWTDDTRRRAGRLFAPALIIAGGVYGQMILGAFVAGLRAGDDIRTWPLMDGKLFPDGYFAGAPGFNDLFETAAAVQFNHRIGAYIVAAAAIWFWRATRNTPIRERGELVLFLTFAQVMLGVMTVVAGAPIGLGLLHQAGALALFAAMLYAAHGARREFG